jgi:endonuclease V-like protein UPF0215 family
VSRIAPNVIGFDDGPFPRAHRGDVLLVGVVTSRTRMDGVVAGKIRRDGANATASMIELVRRSQFIEHIQAVLLQGIAVGGFNVVDTHALHAALGVPVLVVTRRRPDMSEVRRALFSGDPPDRPRVRGAQRKWRLIQAAGELEELKEPRLWVQRIGLTLAQARDLVRATTLHGNLPEPLRLAHLIAGGITTGKSRGRA